MNEFTNLYQEDYLKIYSKLTRAAGQEESLKIIKILKLKKNAKILDLCCGHGRHSIPLGKMGYNVTGIDISEYLLNIARESASSLPVKFINRDMRHIGFNKEFDAVINLSHSFGFFEDDKENFKVLAGIKKALKPGGQFIIDALSPNFIRRNFVPYLEEEKDGELIITKIRLNDDAVISNITVKGSDIREYQETIRYYDLDWFKSAIKKSGMIIDAVYGDFDKNPYNELSSRNMIISGRSKKSLINR